MINIFVISFDNGNVRSAFFLLCYLITCDLHSDVCLEAAKVLPWPCLDVLMPRLGLASPRSYCFGLNATASTSPRSRLFCLASTQGIGTSKLRYDIIIYNFHPFILFISVFQLYEAGAVMVVIKINVVVSCRTVLRT